MTVKQWIDCWVFRNARDAFKHPLHFAGWVRVLIIRLWRGQDVIPFWAWLIFYGISMSMADEILGPEA